MLRPRPHSSGPADRSILSRLVPDQRRRHHDGNHFRHTTQNLLRMATYCRHRDHRPHPYHLTYRLKVPKMSDKNCSLGFIPSRDRNHRLLRGIFHLQIHCYHV